MLNNLATNMRSAFTKADLIIDNAVLTAGQFVKMGSYQVGAGEVVTLGYGQGTQASAEGRIYQKIQSDASTEITGTYRIVLESAQDLPLQVVFEARSEALATSPTDRTLQIPFNEMNVGVSEDKKIVTYFKADTTATVDLANSTLLMDITRTLLG